MLNPRDIRIETRDYVNAHGKAPRGQGSWGFCKVDPRQADYLDHLIWVNDTYGRAKSIARSIAAAQDASVLYVCS